MDAKSVLRVSIIAQWMLLIISLIVSFFFDSSLPPELQDFVSKQSDPTSALPVLLMFAISDVVASIGLLYLKDWARLLYLVNYVLGSALMLGPHVMTNIDYLLEGCIHALSGLIIGISFFTGVISKKMDSVESGPS